MRKQTVVFEVLDRASAVLSRIEGLSAKATAKAEQLRSKLDAAVGPGVGRNADALSARLRGLTLALGGVATAAAALQFGKDALASATQMDSLGRAIRFASGPEAAANFAAMDATVNKFGLDAVSSAEGFKTLAGSMMGTSMQGEPMRQLFDGMAGAVATVGMSAEDSKGAFVALGQMMSKGKVSAEELRGQLGERLDGAFEIAARSMGVTTQQLDKMLEQGQVMAGDFLPKFTKELQRTFGEAGVQAVDSLQAKQNLFNNSLLATKLAAADLFLPMLTQVMQLGGAIMTQLVTPGSALRDTLESVAFGVGTVSVAMGIFYAKTIALRVATVAMTAAQWALNVALSANPIGIVIGLIAGMGLVLAALYQKSEGFRGFVWGLWESIKTVFGYIYDALTGVADIFIGVFTGNLDLIASGIKKNLNFYTEMGGAVGEAFSKGYTDGVARISEGDPATPGVFGKFAQGGGTGGGGMASAAAAASAATVAANPGGAVASAMKEVAGGGKPSSITVNVGKIQAAERITLSATQGIADIEAQLQEAILRALNSATASYNIQ